MGKRSDALGRMGVAVAACAGELPTGEAPAEIKLFPAGSFRARDGRPEDVPAWLMDADAAARLVADADAAAGEYVIDYEHQTLHAEANGQPAPAAGWFKQLDWREGDGLYAAVRWTDQARRYIEAGEYRYISPVFAYDENTGVVTALLMAALTNYPALDGHSDLALMAAAKFKIEEDDVMDRKQLIALLGLAENASDEQIETALAALKAKAGEADRKDGEIAALKAAAGKPDPARYVPVEAFESLKGEVHTLKQGQATAAVDALVKQGLDEGRLLPVQEDWARELGGNDIAALRSYLEKTPAIAALGGMQSGGKPPEQGRQGAALTETELAVCKSLGLTEEEYTKQKTAA